jgi:cytochrome oxidase Cu insertion factor (SCO1/SenC/PrrC family)
MNERADTEESRRKRSLTPLWVLLAVTVLPYVLGWWYFSHQDAVPLGEAGNKGDLVTPVRELPALPLETLEGETAATGDLLGKWTLIAVGPGACSEACERDLYFLRQIRRAMGEERFRVQRLYLATDAEDLRGLREKLAAEYEGTRVVTGPAASRERLLELLRVNGIEDPTGARFIVDPLGNLMMSYPADSNPEDTADDLRRLLELSRIG